jgi:hypothetical protein
MASEETPLISSSAELAHEALYNRFSPSRKRVIVALVSASATLPSEFTYDQTMNRLKTISSVREWDVHTVHTPDRRGF